MPKEKRNRRKSHDIWYYISQTLAIGGWLLFIIALGVSYYAAPEADYGMYRYYGIEIRRFWLTPLTGYLYIVLWVSALSSYFCIIIDHFRKRNGAEKSHFSLILLMLVSMSWIIYILMQLK
jgi:preprotein translocase subunit SecE